MISIHKFNFQRFLSMKCPNLLIQRYRSMKSSMNGIVWMILCGVTVWVYVCVPLFISFFVFAIYHLRSFFPLQPPHTLSLLPAPCATVSSSTPRRGCGHTKALKPPSPGCWLGMSGWPSGIPGWLTGVVRSQVRRGEWYLGLLLPQYPGLFWGLWVCKHVTSLVFTCSLHQYI